MWLSGVVPGSLSRLPGVRDNSRFFACSHGLLQGGLPGALPRPFCLSCPIPACQSLQYTSAGDSGKTSWPLGQWLSYLLRLPPAGFPVFACRGIFAPALAMPSAAHPARQRSAESGAPLPIAFRYSRFSQHGQALGWKGLPHGRAGARPAVAP